MPKLATPVQYEPALEQLNEVRPLILPDEVKQKISISVGCVNPPTVGRPAVGKMLRCVSQGALTVKNNSEVFSSVVSVFISFEEETIFRGIDVSPNCKGLIYRVGTLSYPAEKIYWSNSDGDFLKDLGKGGNNWLPFRGDTFWIKESIAMEEADIRIWHFH